MEIVYSRQTFLFDLNQFRYYLVKMSEKFEWTDEVQLLEHAENIIIIERMTL